MFEVVFQGGIAAGANPDEVKAKIGLLFKVNDAQLARLFSGQRVVIKSNLDEATAAKYRMAIEKTGALCEVVAMAAFSPTATSQIPPNTSAAGAPTTSVSSATPSQTVSRVSPSVPPSSTATPADFSVAPVGVELGDNKPFVPANINVEHLSTAPVGADLEQLKVDITPFHLDVDFEVAPVGSDLEEMPRLVAPIVLSEEVDNVSIAPVGADLSDSKPMVAVTVKELNVDIAPAGSDLGEIKKDAPPPPPDTSHLSVDPT